MKKIYLAAQALSNSAAANRIALNSHNEQYHFLMAINKYGVKQVVDETSKLLMEQGLDYLEATRQAINRVSYNIEVANGKSTFQNVRNRLESPNSDLVHHTAHTDFIPI